MVVGVKREDIFLEADFAISLNNTVEVDAFSTLLLPSSEGSLFLALRVFPSANSDQTISARRKYDCFGLGFLKG